MSYCWKGYLLTLQTDEKYGTAWGEFTIVGRVRPWDGLILLLRTPVRSVGRFVFYSTADYAPRPILIRRTLGDGFSEATSMIKILSADGERLRHPWTS